MIETYWPTILACAVVTVSVRAVPIVLLSRVEMPDFVQRWLGFVPAAIMAAIIVAELIANPAWTPTGISVSTLAALTCLAVGLLSRSLFATVLTGIVAFLLLKAHLP